MTKKVGGVGERDLGRKDDRGCNICGEGMRLVASGNPLTHLANVLARLILITSGINHWCATMQLP